MRPRFFLFLLFIIYLYNSLRIKCSSLLGIDFGNEYIKVSIVSPGKGFNILLNNQSKRKITNSISFANKFRTYDEESKIYSTKYPQLTLLNSNNILGYNLFDSLKNKENFVIENYDENNEEFYSDINNYDFSNDFGSKYYSYDYVVDHKRGTINIKLKDNMVISSEEVTANILGYIKKLAYTHLNIDYKVKRNINLNIGCVISVPCNFSQRKKQALINASKIAGLELLGIINGVTAAAIHNVHDIPLNTTKLTMYLDIGSKNINVGIATISFVEKDKVRSRSVQVYACESLENNSGNKIDMLLAENLRKKFEEKYNVSIENDKKAMRKLIVAANKAKLLLSAKKSADVFIESLYNNKSLNESVSRQDFEELIQEVIENMKIPINKALEKGGFQLKDIEALELIGSGWRVPKILNEVTEFFNPLKVGMHLNSDEAVTMGSLYIAAYNSANFRLKDLDYKDIVSNEYHILVNTDEEENNTTNEEKVNIKKELVNYNSRYPHNKNVILTYKDNLKFSVYENGKIINEYVLGNLDNAIKSKYEHLGTPKLNLKFHLDKFGILSLDKVLVVYEEQKDGAGDTKDNKKEGDEENNNNNNNEEINKDDDTNNNKSDDEQNKGDENKSNDENKENEENKQNGEKKKNDIIKHNIPIEFQTRNIKPLPLTFEEIKEKKEILKNLDEHDIDIFLKSEKKNTLESFIYETRSKMKQDIYKQVTKEETRNEYLNKLEEYEDWLYTEKDEPLENVSNKIHELQDIYNPIKERAEELQVRDKIIEETNKKIQEMIEKIKDLSEKKPWAAETIKMVKDSLDKEVQWWNHAQEEQKKLDNYTAPFFKHKDVQLKFKSIQMLIKTLDKLKKPVEKKEDKKNTDNQNENTSKQDAGADKNHNTTENQNEQSAQNQNNENNDDNQNNEHDANQSSNDEQNKNDGASDQKDEL